ncbi:MAG: response regulator receiver modulated metal-depenent phosphohydrolase [Candidatus Tectimicrobiota bacterium]|nr:MAG: response regulator receiver modulated metal-depenent phosphohydrolase [Candidatus Tectomicrobia bacterium]
MSDAILFVDDDVNVLEAYRRVLRRHFAIETAAGGAAGLALLEQKGPFAVVVSDLRMPGMDGVQFLTAVRQRAPDTVRVMLTGQADITAAIAAINEGHIFRFLTKPCPPELLLRALEDALAQYRLVTAERTLLEQTLHGSVKVLTDVLALVNPAAFGQSARLKHYVRHISERLGLAERWQFELAAMLSHLGCVTLPAETLEKVYAGQPLSPEEERMFAAHPEVGHDLLRHIPRLEGVAQMIARQREPCGANGACPPLEALDPVTLGARLLKVVLAFDQLVARGVPHRRAVAELRQHPEAYHPALVEALEDVDAAGTAMVLRLVTVRDLFPGMVLDEDVRTTSGVLVLAKGHEVTPALVQRLRSFALKAKIVEPFRVLVPRHDA